MLSSDVSDKITTRLNSSTSFLAIGHISESEGPTCYRTDVTLVKFAQTHDHTLKLSK